MGDATMNTNFAVIGHYCPTDANPETERADKISVEFCETLEDAKQMLQWYPGGSIYVPLGEVTRLREALERIASDAVNPRGVTRATRQEIARAALGGGSDE